MRSEGPAGHSSGRSKSDCFSVRKQRCPVHRRDLCHGPDILVVSHTVGVNQPGMSQTIPTVTVVVSPLRMARIISRMWQDADG
jgi:hypothetical protein